MSRTILHADLNSCYASIECLHRPELRELPVAVGGDEESRHGIILAKNDLAKKFGVRTGEALWQARQKCPGLVTVRPRFELYLRFCRMAREIYCDYSDRIEPFGMDEAWIDLTGCERDGAVTATEIRERVKAELGITVSVGVADNKVFAKLGSDYTKPDAVTVFTRENFREKIWVLPAEELLYVGPATKRKLNNFGIKTIGDLAQTDPLLLQRWLGKWGLILHRYANGEDDSKVAQSGEISEIKSLGNSTTPPRDLTCDEDAKIIFFMLAESVAERLREEGFMARTVQIYLRDNELFSFERQLRLEAPTCLASQIHAAAMSLLRANFDWHIPLRSIGIRTADLIPATTPVQLSVFEDEARREQRERIERTMDDIRRRFGHYAVCRASATVDKTLQNINPKDDHIYGFISHGGRPDQLAGVQGEGHHSSQRSGSHNAGGENNPHRCV